MRFQSLTPAPFTAGASTDTWPATKLVNAAGLAVMPKVEHLFFDLAAGQNLVAGGVQPGHHVGGHAGRPAEAEKVVEHQLVAGFEVAINKVAVYDYLACAASFFNLKFRNYSASPPARKTSVSEEKKKLPTQRRKAAKAAKKPRKS